VVQLLLQLFLDHVPTILCMGYDAPGTVFETRGQDTEVARTCEEEKGTVTEKARFPVIEIMARQKFASGIDKVFVVHIFTFFPLFFLFLCIFAFALCSMLRALRPLAL
jgi:hypothetical protein